MDKPGKKKEKKSGGVPSLFLPASRSTENLLQPEEVLPPPPPRRATSLLKIAATTSAVINDILRSASPSGSLGNVTPTSVDSGGQQSPSSLSPHSPGSSGNTTPNRDSPSKRKPRRQLPSFINSPRGVVEVRPMTMLTDIDYILQNLAGVITDYSVLWVEKQSLSFVSCLYIPGIFIYKDSQTLYARVQHHERLAETVLITEEEKIKLSDFEKIIYGEVLSAEIVKKIKDSITKNCKFRPYSTLEDKLENVIKLILENNMATKPNDSDLKGIDVRLHRIRNIIKGEDEKALFCDEKIFKAALSCIKEMELLSEEIVKYYENFIQLSNSTTQEMMEMEIEIKNLENFLHQHEGIGIFLSNNNRNNKTVAFYALQILKTTLSERLEKLEIFVDDPKEAKSKKMKVAELYKLNYVYLDGHYDDDGKTILFSGKVTLFLQKMEKETIVENYLVMEKERTPRKTESPHP